MIRILTAAAIAAVSLAAQPRFPQHSTGMPAIQLPVIQNHITNLGATVAGRPVPQAPNSLPVRPIRPYPVIVGGGYYPQPVVPMQPVSPVYFVNQQNVAPAAPPVLVVNPDYTPEVAKPVMREYSNIKNPYENFQPDKPKVFLLALKDGSLRQSVAFWSEGGKLHFIQPDHKPDSLQWTLLDRESTKRFNSERGIEINLPVE
ncbi:MAG TPA: hypothetical protein VFQ91_26955 [Bryobacteraceae bacterium]|nr:hypothetical protein [Bryobacteraceae bacterium]